MFIIGFKNDFGVTVEINKNNKGGSYINREWKRRMKHNRGVVRNTNKISALLLDVLQLAQENRELKEGDTVRLKYSQICNRKDWNNKSEKYKQFICDNKDSIFTVEADYSGRFPFPSFVCLKEDETEPKWIFWEGDVEKFSPSKA